jgi:tRNA G18 (ribose-2'-O)-methylase SpoU
VNAVPGDRLLPIHDLDDPRLDAYRDIQERDVAGRGGFIAEGEVVLNVLARSRRHRARSILIAAKRAERLAPLLARFPVATPIYTAEQAVLDGVAGFHLHRGILADGARAPSLPAAELLREAAGRLSPILMLFGISNHDNMGGLFRNAAAFGVSAVLLDPTCCDPLYRKAIRVSVGAALEVPFARLAADENALGLLAAHGFTPLALSPTGERRLIDLKPPPRAALLLGAEGAGLPAAILAGALTVSIPMAGAFDSLNVATACGIALHHLVFTGRE